MKQPPPRPTSLPSLHPSRPVHYSQFLSLLLSDIHLHTLKKVHLSHYFSIYQFWMLPIASMSLPFLLISFYHNLGLNSQYKYHSLLSLALTYYFFKKNSLLSSPAWFFSV